MTAAGRLPSSAADQVLGAAKHAFVGAMHEVALTSAGLLAVVAVTTLFTLRGLPAVFPSDVDADVADADAGVADTDAGVADADASVADADASDAAEACGEFAVS